ncbi:hypothetical protein Acr_00g0068090 [Actinidia rufa]|uniref:Uncharacterized protein n=1 Tax=Actinidia rufa TaxID=165716 RepID=A0A7J0DQL5_9ERIC|nr:hypothetical protein Acr_00g0068090 [Actinidia rufa]
MIKRGISINSIKDEGQEDDGDEGTSHHTMEVEGNLEIPSSIQWQDDKAIHEEVPMQREYQMHEKAPMQREFPMHGRHPSQEGTSSQGGPPAWFLDYFGKLNESLVRIVQR